MAYSVLISAWPVGALGGLHCLAVRGGFKIAIAARDGRWRRYGAPAIGTGDRAPAARLPCRSKHDVHVVSHRFWRGRLGSATGAHLLPLQWTMYLIA